MSPLERAARALHETTRETRYIRDPESPSSPPREVTKPPVAWDGLADSVRASYVSQARAVLGAIREPSEGMIEAYANGVSRGLAPGESVGPEAYRLREDGFAAMIDAVLSDPGSP